MATEKKTATADPRLETSIAEDRTTSAVAGTGQTTDVSGNGLELDLADIEQEEPDGETVKEEASEEGDGEGETQEEADLGDYDGSEEARAKFDAKYLTPGEDGKPGQINQAAIGAEFWANQAKAGADAKDHGHLNEATYKWAEETFGVDRAFITEYEQGLVAKSLIAKQTFFGKIDGGEAAYRGAVAWAVGGGYTPEQRTRFNALQAKGGEDFEDAVDALMARARKANPQGIPAPKAAPVDGRRNRRGSAPARDVTGNAGAGNAGGEAYTAEQHSVAWSAALKERGEARKSGDPARKREAEKALDALQAKARKAFRR